MSNVTGPWCVRDNELCEHNLSDAPHVMRDVCSGIGGECRQGSGFSSGRSKEPMSDSPLFGPTQWWLDENTPLTPETWEKLRARLKRVEPHFSWATAFENFHVTPEERELQQILSDKMQQWHAKLAAGLMGVDIGNAGDQTCLLAIPGALPMSGYSAATPQHEPTGTEIMDAITAAFERLKENPIVTAIWFVDCPDQRAKFDSVMRRALIKETPVQSEYSAAFGIPLLDWDSTADYKDEAKSMGLDESDAHLLKSKDRADQIRAGRWFILMPGVWAEMSDGRHRRVEL